MDEIDSKIIELLKEDGRASDAEIARSLGVSEGTIRRRLKRLIDEEYIKIVAVLDPAKMGYGSQALIGVQVNPDSIDNVADEISNLQEISWVAATTGKYDLFAWTTVQSSEALGVFLRTVIGTIPGVRRTETFVNLAIRKRGNSVMI